MPIVECKDDGESGRTYLLELGNLILREMTPTVMNDFPKSLQEKFAKFTKQVGKDMFEELSVFDIIQGIESSMGLEEEEEKLLWGLVDDDNVGPETLVHCLRRVKNGTDEWMSPSDLPNMFDDDKPYGSIGAFVERDEELVNDCPKLLGHVHKALTSFYGSVALRGELKPSSEPREPKKAN